MSGMRSCWRLCAAFCAALALSSGAPAADPEEYAEQMSPGAAHARLRELLVGDWEMTRRVWQQPGVEPMVMRGRARAEATSGGRYVELRAPLTGGDWGDVTLEAVYGYNGWARRYEMSGRMSHDTGQVFYTGQWDEERGALTLEAEFPIKAEGGPDFVMTMRATLSSEGPDRRKITVIFVYPGMGEHKAIEDILVREAPAVPPARRLY